VCDAGLFLSEKKTLIQCQIQFQYWKIIEYLQNKVGQSYNILKAPHYNKIRQKFEIQTIIY